MKKLWGRIGMSVDCSEEEYQKLINLMGTDTEKAEEFLLHLFTTKGVMDGESYLPEDCDDNPNEEEFDF